MSRKFIVIDTETAPTIPTPYPVPKNSRAYDLGFMVCDREGNIYEKYSFVIAEVFYNHDLMNSAYYAEKIPAYEAGLGKAWKVVDFFTAYATFAEMVSKYSVRDIWAYNHGFDYKVLNATIEDLSNGFVKQFYPENCTVRDIWDYAGSTICNTRKYVDYCKVNGYISDKGNPQTKAEIVYRYITGNSDFIEAHTALEDCEIEFEILRKALKRHQKSRQSCGQGWRDAASIAKALA